MPSWKKIQHCAEVRQGRCSPPPGCSFVSLVLFLPCWMSRGKLREWVSTEQRRTRGRLQSPAAMCAHPEWTHVPAFLWFEKFTFAKTNALLNENHKIKCKKKIHI
ncbi:hypothetical protein FQA47_007557 [Oryzias melastigma]|uniref:Uncharacterized protein n=1 Tax=Oryzias melastigma TaxID=30732 RepID=A0A834CE63_ORYME|nr:hypothetical protein FQA47_007557 [Oryzias melastigma]